MKNIKTKGTLNHSAFRKLAIGSWGRPKDPKVYTKVTCEISEVLHLLKSDEDNQFVTLTHFFTKVMSELVSTYPELNCVLIRNKLKQYNYTNTKVK